MAALRESITHLRIVLGFALFAPWLPLNLVAAMGQLLPNEVLVYGSLESIPSGSAAFMTRRDMAFVGRLEAVQSEVLDPSTTEELATKLTFVPTESIEGNVSLSAAKELWTPGGTFLNTPAGRVARAPAEAASKLQIGASYFVAADTMDGCSWIIASTLIGMDGPIPNPPSGTQTWMDGVISEGRTQLLTINPARNPTARESFLHALHVASGS